MAYRLAFELDGLPSINTADNRHWRVRQKERDFWYGKVLARVATRNRLRPRLDRAHVRIVRRSSVEPDFENMAQGGKFILDALVLFGVLSDDSPAVIGQPTYEWEKTPPRCGSVFVEVVEVAE